MNTNAYIRSYVVFRKPTRLVVEGERRGKMLGRGAKKKKKLTWKDTICGKNDTETISTDDKGSHGFYTDMLPSLGAHNSSKIKLRPFTISPFNPYTGIHCHSVLL